MSDRELPSKVAVLGAGTIGVGAAIALAAHRVPVTLATRRTDADAQIWAAIDRRLAWIHELGACAGSPASTARDHLSIGHGILDGGPFDLIFEAVEENLDAKRRALADAEGRLAPEGILATTTSSLSVDPLATALTGPGRFAAWHWFRPADLMQLVEIVPGAATETDVVATLRAWSTAIGKQPIVLHHDTPGFVANRLQYALLREAYALVGDGVCDVGDVDLAVTAALGPRWSAVGPFASMDLAGLDVHAAVAERLFADLSRDTTVPERLTALRAAGASGARDGRGLLGSYEPAQLHALERRRDQALIALSRGRE